MEGVTEAYAIQAGREIRVIVAPDTISEPDAALLARKIRRRIEDELQYPGTIRVNLLRGIAPRRRAGGPTAKPCVPLRIAA